MKFLLIALLAPLSAFAHDYNCTMIGGDKDDGRISRKIELSIDAREAAVTGYVFGKKEKATGTRLKKEDSRGQAAYSGFGGIQDDNADLRAYADLSLLQGNPGKFSFWLLGDGEDSVDLRYDYNCK